jgi:hypothetical protein
LVIALGNDNSHLWHRHTVASDKACKIFLWPHTTTPRSFLSPHYSFLDTRRWAHLAICQWRARALPAACVGKPALLQTELVV